MKIQLLASPSSHLTRLCHLANFCRSAHSEHSPLSFRTGPAPKPRPGLPSGLIFRLPQLLCPPAPPQVYFPGCDLAAVSPGRLCSRPRFGHCSGAMSWARSPGLPVTTSAAAGHTRLLSADGPSPSLLSSSSRPAHGRPLPPQLDRKPYKSRALDFLYPEHLTQRPGP